MSPADQEPLPEPAVASDEYDSRYYLHSCIGSDEWRDSNGSEAAPIYRGALKLARLSPGERVLDVGTGRADLLPVALDLGASKAVGVDYSEAALELAKTTLSKAGDPPNAAAILADARRIPVDSGSFDLVTMLDVVEHLDPTELAASLSEVHRALRPGGRLFVHTAPNAWVYSVTYPIQRHLRPGRPASWPANPRNEHEKAMHVNEQSPLALRRVLRDAGFGSVKVRLGGWVHTDFVPDGGSRRAYSVMAKAPVLRWLSRFDLFAWAGKPAS